MCMMKIRLIKKMKAIIDDIVVYNNETIFFLKKKIEK